MLTYDFIGYQESRWSHESGSASQPDVTVTVRATDSDSESEAYPWQCQVAGKLPTQSGSDSESRSPAEAGPCSGAAHWLRLRVSAGGDPPPGPPPSTAGPPASHGHESDSESESACPAGKLTVTARAACWPGAAHWQADPVTVTVAVTGPVTVTVTVAVTGPGDSCGRARVGLVTRRPRRGGPGPGWDSDCDLPATVTPGDSAGEQSESVRA